jgi:hypothetical protein
MSFGDAGTKLLHVHNYEFRPNHPHSIFSPCLCASVVYFFCLTTENTSVLGRSQ